MNIILLTFDSLRQDCVGAYGKSPPWGPVLTPNLDAFAREALLFERLYPEVLPTLPVRRALYTGQRVYPFVDGDIRLKGDEVYAPGWGPVREEQSTVAELFQERGYRTALISDLYHQFKPSKNFTRGFDQWSFLRGQEIDRYRSGPQPSQAEIDRWLAPELQGDSGKGVEFVRRCLQNWHGRRLDEDSFCARVMLAACRWLEENREADSFFLTVECFDPHEPWFVPDFYRRLYDRSEGREHVISTYAETADLPTDLLHRAQMNYSGLVTQCDRWFGHFYATLRQLGRLEDTIIVVASDHGHSIGDRGYMGKRGYPSDPSVYETVLMIRHPEGLGAGKRSDHFLQHTDVAAQLLDFAKIAADQPLDGRPFWQGVIDDRPGERGHVTVGWGADVTVINAQWWLNARVDGSRPLLYALDATDPFAINVAADNPQQVQELLALAVSDAGGAFPEFLIQEARGEAELPKWNPLAPAGQSLGYL